MNKRILAIITARMGSTRLKGKVMLPLAGKPILEHLIERIKESHLFEKTVIATSLDRQNLPLLQLARKCGIESYQGKEEDVLDRYAEIVRTYHAEHCVRFCADNPLTDMETTAELVQKHLESNSDYTCVKGLQLQLGLVEVFSRRALEITHASTDETNPMYRESIGLFIRENASRFKISTLPPDPFLHQSPYRLTVDYPEDYEMMQILFSRLYQGRPIAYRSALEFLQNNPDIARMNAHVVQKKGNQYWEELDRNLP